MHTTFSYLPDLASAALGAQILFATDDFFAVAENLILPTDPKWDKDAYTPYGKWMDGWETRRRRIPGHDCVHVDTEFFKGNYPESCLLQGTDHPGPDLDNADWFDIVPRSRLTANALHSFESSSGNPCTHVKLSIFPDGGVSRLRVFGYIL
ncbi:allantoicase [Synchytrium endobioticum]|uniref:Allantoicase n=1 Tax=Synchytrium endobioticum TaxID=286115 RepID=A0A507DGI9_9FUNG|nr:allantoicase [Synchytrium endobioticum]